MTLKRYSKLLGILHTQVNKDNLLSKKLRADTVSEEWVPNSL